MDLRKEAEASYNATAHDHIAAPVGSRDWALYWRGYQAGAAAHLNRGAIRYRATVGWDHGTEVIEGVMSASIKGRETSR